MATPLPEHALAEIENPRLSEDALKEIGNPKLSKQARAVLHADWVERERALQVAYWAAWAAVGDAKQVEAEASQQVIDVENDWHACCIAHQINLPSCGCGEHPGRYVAARQTRDQARADIAAAIETFKAV